MEDVKPSSAAEDDKQSTAGYTLGNASPPALPKQLLDLKPGTIIDDFFILSTISSGGCGIVYKAQQRSISREVALKLIRPELSVQEVIERFEVEKSTLGKLNDENIVNIIAGGRTTPELGGVPFFAMEFVDGRPITEYAEKNHLSVPDRLELFLQVCNAIEHAHSEGVIHRDIKPANILVTEKTNRKPLVKVIDFGVAKAVNNGLPLAYATQVGQLIGTLAYMSPEQTGQNPDLVNERSDIYSMGLVLYELLVGCKPYDVSGDRINQIKVIREAQPPRPSIRIAKQRSAGCALVKQRSVSLSQLEHLLRGDLDQIIMKCLEKNSYQRYETVADLIDDIKRHLSCKKLTIQAVINNSGKSAVAFFALVIAIIGTTIIFRNLGSDKPEQKQALAVSSVIPPTSTSDLTTDDVKIPNEIIIVTINKLNASSRP